ncbi:hypothetical protein LTR62_004886 [Meristemomyces frigidus]|uniref:LCCL domain-containing protein n=1 Tax=Meristemomyces frigidus TaxID=1508187 RepID=A0AAN7TEM5_9PEZI|nr:hypothetical protein LTR62_004886 [Meristemomyces frigidus]
MGRHDPTDEEAAVNDRRSLDGSTDQYHDDSDDDATVGADAPLRGPGNSSRPSFDGLRLGGGNTNNNTPSWLNNFSDQFPPSLQQAWQKTKTWTKGPDPPRIFTITPLFPSIQHLPITLLDRFVPSKLHRFGLLLLILASWLLSFSLVLRASSFSASVPGYGTPLRLHCGAAYWEEGNGCGLNGNRCRPFANETLAFRCPADCHKIQALNPHAVGDQEIVYRSLVVGGPPPDNSTSFPRDITLVNNAIYRSDSFICPAAIHAGFLSPTTGGCGVLKLTGEQSHFASSTRHGIESISFPSYFPQTFGFIPGTHAQCHDLRWPALGVSVAFTTLLSLFTLSPLVFFWSNFTILFFQTALASDPPNLTTYHDLLSLAFGRFLPAAFCGWVTYRYTVRRSLLGLTAQVEKTVLWLGAAWVGALNNHTFDKIPIQRLTPHDLRAQPGAIPALIAVVLTIFCIALGQAWAFRLEGRMPRYLAVYGILVSSILVMLALPGLNLRIHHYILALLLLPGTSFQNRPSLLYQGLLVGLFVNGIARWGFDSILQTPGELLAGAQRGTLLPDVQVMGVGAEKITFGLGKLPQYDRKADVTFDGISVLVNDVERFRGYGDDDSDWGGLEGNLTWTWHRHHVHGHGNEDDVDNDLDDLRNSDIEVTVDDDNAVQIEARRRHLPEYFRFGYMSGSSVGDYSKAGVWDEDGLWRKMEDGPSL